MDKNEICSFIGKETGTKLYNKIFMMKQEKLSKESGDIGFNAMDATPSFLDDIFDPNDIVPQTIEESLEKAKIKNIQKILDDCTPKVDELEEKDVLDFLGMSRDEAYAVLVYTYQADVYEESPYRVLNQALLDHNMEKLKSLRGFVLTLLSGLRKIKSDLPNCLYRGIDGKWLSSDDNNFIIGNVCTFTPFTSTSFDEDSAKKFMSRNDVKEPILYEMHGVFPGHLIYKISTFKDEKGI